MADDSIEVTDDLPFHPTDSPRAMHYYNMEILTKSQQKKLNDYKRKTIRNTEKYLNDHPTVRALVAIIYRVVLSTQPRQNLHVTIAEYFSKPKPEIENDVNEYLRKRGPKVDDYIYVSKSVGDDDDMFYESDSETEIASINYPDQMEADMKDELSRAAEEAKDYIISTRDVEFTNDAKFMHDMVTQNLYQQLQQRPSISGEQIYSSQFLGIDENGEVWKADLKKITGAQLMPESIVQGDILSIDSKLKGKKKVGQKVSMTDMLISEKNEEDWLVLMSTQHAERHKVLLESMQSTSIDPDRSRRWQVVQMINAEKQWRLLQIALQGKIAPEVQDALRDWQIALMESTQDMSPEQKEAQMDWLEGQMTQGGNMSKSMVQILRLWQGHILLLGTVMTTDMISNEMKKLHEEMAEVKEFSIDNQEEQSDRIQSQLKQMERITVMIKAMQDLERQWLQDKIDVEGQDGYLTPGTLQTIIKHLNLQKHHDLLMEEEFEARMKIIMDQLNYGKNTTYETLIAHKRWIEWQIGQKKISQRFYELQREFLNYQLGKIGITSSQMLLKQMDWLQNEKKNNYISNEAYDNQKKILEYRIEQLNKVTIPILEEQLDWLENQFECGNISLTKYEDEKDVLIKNIEKIISENKTVEDLQYDLKILQREFGERKMAEIEFQTKKKYLKERITQIKKNASQMLIADMQLLDLKLKAGDISNDEYEQRKLVIQQEIDAKTSQRTFITFTENTLRGSIATDADTDKQSAIPPATLVTQKEDQNEDKNENENVNKNENKDEDKDKETKGSIMDDSLLTSTSPTNLVEDREIEADIIDIRPINVPTDDEEYTDKDQEKQPEIAEINQVKSVVNFDESPIAEKSNEGFKPDELPPVSLKRRASRRLSIVDVARTDGDKILRKSLIEIQSLDRRTSIRQLIPIELETATEDKVSDLTETSPSTYSVNDPKEDKN